LAEQVVFLSVKKTIHMTRSGINVAPFDNHTRNLYHMKPKIYASARTLILVSILSVLTNIHTAFAQQFLTSIDGWNAYVHLPDDYNDSVTKRYPLICFVPGVGEVGTDPSRLLLYGPSKFIAEGHNMQFTVNGKLEKPIVISIQPAAAWPNPFVMNRKLDSILARYRCDLQRINVTGLSMGGWSWTNFVDNYSPAYTNRITSIVSMSAPAPDNGISNMRFFPQAGGTAWLIEGNMDMRGNDKVRDTMNSYVAGSARYTLYSGGHCCWNTFYNPTWVENGESIYSWMMKQRKALIAGPVYPQVDAGNDSSTSTISIALPLRGFGNDPNGLPINISWTKIAGSGGTIVNPGTLQTNVSGLSMGTYKFELKVTNSVGLVAKDTVTINNGNVVLPVTLVDFTARAIDSKSVLVQWNTSAEINSDYFIVEKSSDALSFSEGQRTLAKNSNGARYSFTDYMPQTGTNFYRLKMVDKDGKFAYSKIVSVFIQNTHEALSVSPAYISNNQVRINISSTKSQPATVFIIDASGKRIGSTPVALNKGINNISTSANLASGVYYVKVATTNDQVTTTFMRN
jgi:hypothetical protein